MQEVYHNIAPFKGELSRVGGLEGLHMCAAAPCSRGKQMRKLRFHEKRSTSGFRCTTQRRCRPWMTHCQRTLPFLHVLQPKK